MIEVKGLTKRYGSNTAVDNISFTLEKDHIYGFLGPNGAGKSTTMNMLTGYLAANDGSVVIDGFDILKDPVKAKKNIGYLPEIPPLYPDMTVREYLMFAAELKGMSKKEGRGAVEDVMKKTLVEDMSERLIKNLSKGYKQRVGLAQAIMGYPDVIILDEPTVGLDPKQIIEIRELIKELRTGHTIILSSHILQEISAVCDHILIISHGKLVASDTAENISNSMKGIGKVYLTVKGSDENVINAAASVDGADKIETERGKEDGTVDVCISHSSDKDLREGIFYAFSGSSLPILEMRSSCESLEDIYLKLTEGEGEEVSKAEESDPKETEGSDKESDPEETEGSDKESDPETNSTVEKEEEA